MKCIDFHVHTFPDKIAEKAVTKLAGISGITPCTDGTVKKTLSVLSKAGVTLGVSLNIATSPAQQRSINDHAAYLNGAVGDRLLSFGSVHPDAEDAVDELSRIRSLGIRGIKLHPDYQGFMVDDEKLFPIYARCAELGLPVVLHAGWDCYSPDKVHNPPERAAEVAELFPDLTIILAHLGGLRRWDGVLEHLCGRKNIFFDTAIAASECPKETAKILLKNHPHDRFLLGSDCPWEHPADSIRYVQALSLSEESLEKVLWKNAANLLGLA